MLLRIAGRDQRAVVEFVRTVDQHRNGCCRTSGVEMKSIQSLIATAAVLASSSAFAQYTDGVIKIGVLVDMSGLYADLGGSGSVVAAKLAVEDFGAAAKGMKVEIISADHQNKAILRRASPAPGST
jgi:ABC-type branched-subunit amino acid transport system substrate-binding protein